MSSPTENDPFTGQVLDGRYELLEQLRTTDAQTLYRALDRDDDNEVCVKILTPPQESDEQYHAGFLRQAGELSNINHPNVQNVLGFGLHEGRPYLAVPYVDAKPLREVLAERGALPPALVVELAHQISAALEAGHQLGIQHGGLSADAILVLQGFSGNEQALVGDFGLSRLLTGDEAGGAMTKSGQIIGSPEYMSPEQIRGEEVGLQSDLYSFAVVVFEMLCGRVPFPMESASAEGIMDVLMRQATEPPPSVRQFGGSNEISEELDAVVLQALSKSPAARPASPGEFARQLSEASAALSFQLPAEEDEHLRDTTELTSRARRPTSELPSEESKQPRSFDEEPTVPIGRSDYDDPLTTLLDEEQPNTPQEPSRAVSEDPFAAQDDLPAEAAGEESVGAEQPPDPIANYGETAGSRQDDLRRTTIITDPSYPYLPEEEAPSEAEEPESPLFGTDEPQDTSAFAFDQELSRPAGEAASPEDDPFAQQPDPLSAFSEGERPSSMFDESPQSFGELEGEPEEFSFPRDSSDSEQEDELAEMDLSEASNQLRGRFSRHRPLKLLTGIGAGALAAVLVVFLYSKFSGPSKPATPFEQSEGSMLGTDESDEQAALTDQQQDATAGGDGLAQDGVGTGGADAGAGITQQQQPRKIGIVNLQEVLLASIAGQDLQQQYMERYKEIRQMPDYKAQLERLHIANTRIVGEYLKELKRTVQEYGTANGYALILGADRSPANAPFIADSVVDPGPLLAGTGEPADLNEEILNEYNTMFSDE